MPKESMLTSQEKMNLVYDGIKIGMFDFNIKSVVYKPEEAYICCKVSSLVDPDIESKIEIRPVNARDIILNGAVEITNEEYEFAKTLEIYPIHLVPKERPGENDKVIFVSVINYMLPYVGINAIQSAEEEILLNRQDRD